MGFHVCEYCDGDMRGRPTSSGDVTLFFEDVAYQMPDMILHYIADHGYLPHGMFVGQVLHGNYVGEPRSQEHFRVGYLEGPFDKGPMPPGFFAQLWSLIEKAKRRGNRRQARGC